jgi:dihydroflavonol-4-reductase
VRVFVTGGAGFIGRAVVRALAARGDQVTAVVRDPARAADLLELGAEVRASDLGDPLELGRQMADHDAVLHLAGSYRIGIRPQERPAMWNANVATTERVLDAAIAARVDRTVYVSTANILGNTAGRVLDESHRRQVASQPFLSWYDETKVRAHQLATTRATAGASVLIAMPGTVYGPGDHSAIGQQLEQAYRGRLRYRVLDDLGTSLVHVDDEADGILRVLDRGRVGESYILAGPRQRLRDALELAARLGGHRLTALRIPTAALRLSAPLGPLLGGRGGLPANLAEVISAGSGVTYWASSAKAERDLGFRARDLERGLRDWLMGAADPAVGAGT